MVMWQTGVLRHETVGSAQSASFRFLSLTLMIRADQPVSLEHIIPRVKDVASKRAA